MKDIPNAILSYFKILIGTVNYYLRFPEGILFIPILILMNTPLKLGGFELF